MRVLTTERTCFNHVESPNHSRRLLVVLAALSLGANICALPSESNSLSGRVLEDHTGSPIQRAAVRILPVHQPGAFAELETDREGRFTISVPPTGDYRVEVSKSNYLSVTLHLHSAAKVAPLVRLVRCGIISGRVLGPGGETLRGAYVLAMAVPKDGGWLRPLQLSESDPSTFVSVPDTHAQYRLYNLPPGRYAVGLSYSSPESGVGSGFVTYPDNRNPRIFTVSSGDEYRDVDFLVEKTPLFSIEGKVEPADPEFRIGIDLVEADQPTHAVARASADRDGGFRFRAIPSGSYTLLAVGTARRGELAPKQLFGRARIDVAGANLGGVSVPLLEGSSVVPGIREPQVLGPGCPRRITLSLRPVEDWGGYAGSRSVDVTAGGEQTIAGLAPGLHALTLSHLGDNCYFAGDPYFDPTSAGETHRLLLDLAPAASIRGRLTDVGTAPPTDLVVVLFPSPQEEQTGQIHIAIPDADYAFSFPALRPGDYSIAVRPAWAARGNGWVNGSAAATLKLRGGSATEVSLPAPADATEVRR